MDLAIDLASAVFLLAGSCLAVIGGVGLLRLPDFFSRLHGAGITDETRELLAKLHNEATHIHMQKSKNFKIKS